MRGNFIKKLSEATELPVSLWGSGVPTLTVEGNFSLTVYGCLEILSYEDEKIVLKTGIMSVSVLGKQLTMQAFGGKCVKIGGTICGMTFFDPRASD